MTRVTLTVEQEHLVRLAKLNDPVGAVATAKDQLRDHFRERIEGRRRELVQEWKSEGVYPYAEEPAGAPEKAEREAFDAVAATVATRLPKTKNIEECRRRLHFYRKELEYQSENEHAVDYLVRRHSDAVERLVDLRVLPAQRAALPSADDSVIAD
jgi:hypothetical protein